MCSKIIMCGKVLSLQKSDAEGYSYDIHGNVKTLIQDFPAIAQKFPQHRYKRIEYGYDLISGKVTFLKYQPGKEDAFYHRYRYDADNRLKEAFTSEDGNYFELDARYFYYLHGPLARIELGRYQVQGLDYAYTINGWVKGVNSETLNETRDIGRDGDNNLPNLNKYFARDVFGYALRYYDGDYKAVGASASLNARFIANNLNVIPLYNGNISSTTTPINGLEKIGFDYRYDQLNRLIAATAINGLDTANNTWSMNFLSDYAMRLRYDANGNILSNFRNGATVGGSQLAMDDLKYFYKSGSNQLSYISDTVASANYPDDLDAQQQNNYLYDAIGNLTKDESEDIASIEWDVYGKIKNLKRKAGSPEPALDFSYDGMGNRVSKTVITSTFASAGSYSVPQTEYYVRDAQGNILSTYKLTADTLELEEQVIYGSQRLGVLRRDKRFIKQSGFTLNPNLPIELYNYLNSGEASEGGGKALPEVASTSSTIPGTMTAVVAGKKRYELVNWLGNVHVVVSDRKIAVDDDGDGARDWWRADVRSAGDYYPGGMLMPGRTFNANIYPFGYQGQLKTDEVYGSGNLYSFEFREHDPRLIRFWSNDPLTGKYPFWSPYAFSGNRLIDAFELEGLEPVRKSEEFKGESGKDYGFGSQGATEKTDWKSGSGKNAMQIYDCPDCMGTSGKGGHLMWQKEEQQTSEKPPIDPTFAGTENPSNINVIVPKIEEGQSINLDLNIPFQANTDQFAVLGDAFVDIIKISGALLSNPNYQANVTTNIGARDFPGLITGSSDAALNQNFPFNGRPRGTARQLMQARAQTIRQAIVGFGVAPSQITVGTGNVMRGEIGLNSAINVSNPKKD